ncbi:MAG TPA: HD domain-containing protein [Methanosarcina sp.]|nr:HD domain-containing protein [Methanosarcina sp.]
MEKVTMKKTMLADAIAFATEKHHGQFDKGGKPYILHPLKVMHYLKNDEDEELMCIAVLHDVVEDCFDGNHEAGFQALLELGMTARVIAGVRALTKLPGQSLEVYMMGIKANIDAVRVKLCDLRHNMDARRLKGMSPKDSARMDKYIKMYWELQALVS